MSSGCSADRKTIFVVLLTLAVLALLAGHADARNPDLSDKVINLSGLPGDETAGEKWDDAYQEIVVVGSTVHVLWWTVRYLISEQLVLPALPRRRPDLATQNSPVRYRPH